MKNVKLLTVLVSLLTVSLLSGCDQNKGPKYEEEFLYNDAPAYEPIVFDYNKEIDRLEFTGAYGKKIKVAAFDEAEVGVRAWYTDGTASLSIPMTIKNIPIEDRHYFGEVGEHSIELMYQGKKDKMTFEVIDNPNFPGYTCYFYDRDKKHLETKVVGYYQEAIYTGKPLPEKEEDGDYYYTFIGWNHETKYVFQTTQFVAKYTKLEKNYYAIKPYSQINQGVGFIVNSDKTEGSSLSYLGRVHRCAAYYGETVRHNATDDIELPKPEQTNYTSFIRELNETIVRENITYVNDPEVSTKLYGNTAELVIHPQFAETMNPNYNLKQDSMKVYMEDGTDSVISVLDPVNVTVSSINGALNMLPPKVSKDEEAGYYRAAVIGDYDVYLDCSFKKLKDHVYEIGVFNQFVISPVKYTFKLVAQRSDDGEFKVNFDTKLVVSTKKMYSSADAINWGKW